MRWYESQSPGLQKYQKDTYWLSTTGTKQESISNVSVMNREKFKWRQWSTDERVRVGDVLLDILIQTTGWFENHTIGKVKNKTTCTV